MRRSWVSWVCFGLEREGFVGSNCRPEMGFERRQSQAVLRDAQ